MNTNLLKKLNKGTNQKWTNSRSSLNKKTRFRKT